VKVTKKRLQKILENAKNNRIAVIGDVMLDKYVYGTISRISPEAPVPVVEIEKTEYKLGGAANVANNIKALDAEPVLIGVIGNDYDSKYFLEVMKSLNLITNGIFKESGRPTTSKTRVIAHSQHVLRVDSEVKYDISEQTELKIYNFYKKNIKQFEAVIFQDYNKGVLKKELINKILNLSKKNNIPVYVDPKFQNFFEYKNVTVFKPNRKETADILAMKIDGDESVKAAGKILLERLECEYLVLTRGEKGMMLFDKENDKTVVLNIPTKARKVADVSGAGDTVIATLAVMLSGGANIKEAVSLANLAAGIVCEEVGIIPIYKNALINSYSS
jgi:rfaE bifunctional protein kinase chain/domain